MIYLKKSRLLSLCLSYCVSIFLCLFLFVCLSLFSPHLSQFSFVISSSVSPLMFITFMNNFIWRGFMYLISMAYFAQFSVDRQCALLHNLVNNNSDNSKLQIKCGLSHYTLKLLLMYFQRTRVEFSILYLLGTQNLFYLFYIMYMSSLHTCMCTMYVQNLQRSGEGLWYPRTGVTDGIASCHVSPV